MTRSAGSRHLRVVRLAQAMTRPQGAARERLDHALQIALDPILRSLHSEVALLKALMRSLISPDPPLRLNDASALPSFEPDPDAIAQFRPGRRLAAIGLGVDPDEVVEAPTDAIDAFARRTLRRHVPCLERAIGDLDLLAVDCLADQEARLEAFLESLPSPLLAEFERLEETWARSAADDEARGERLSHVTTERSATAPVDPSDLVEEVRRLLGVLVELSSRADRPGEQSTARAARLIEPLLQLVLEQADAIIDLPPDRGPEGRA